MDLMAQTLNTNDRFEVGKKFVDKKNISRFVSLNRLNSPYASLSVRYKQSVSSGVFCCRTGSSDRRPRLLRHRGRGT